MKRVILISIGILLLAADSVSAQGVCEALGGAWVADEEVVEFVHVWDDNCGVSDVTYEVLFYGWQIHVIERAWAYGYTNCDCPYNGQPRVSGLVAGNYQVIWDYYLTFEMDSWADEFIRCSTFTVNVPENDVGGEPVLAGYTVEGCGIEVTGVPDPPDGRRTFTDIRARFR